jgi:hypothetical protein
MKKMFAGLMVIVILIIAACNNNKEHDDRNHDHDTNHDKMQMDTMKDMKHDSMSGMNHDKKGDSLTGMGDDMVVTKTNKDKTDPVVTKFINTVTRQYLFIKNGLAADNNAEAKTGATQLAGTIKKFDKSYFNTGQKKEFDKYGDNINGQLQGIISTKQIEEQRSFFGLLSQQVYELIKVFGANQVLYHDHCPMAFNNKGAMWLSETKEIRNPYFGSNMLNCGTVQEIIQ